jgi:hypothetical protein
MEDPFIKALFSIRPGLGLGRFIDQNRPAWKDSGRLQWHHGGTLETNGSFRWCAMCKGWRHWRGQYQIKAPWEVNR